MDKSIALTIIVSLLIVVFVIFLIEQEDPMATLKGYLSPILKLLPVFIILVLIFLLCRTFVLWYWKIGKIVKLLEEIVNTLKKHG